MMMINERFVLRERGHTIPNHITASADADHAGGKDRRSVSGWAVMLNGAMVT
jgi:hypothetical protein